MNWNMVPVYLETLCNTLHNWQNVNWSLSHPYKTYKTPLSGSLKKKKKKPCQQLPSWAAYFSGLLRQELSAETLEPQCMLVWCSWLVIHLLLQLKPLLVLPRSWSDSENHKRQLKGVSEPQKNGKCLFWMSFDRGGKLSGEPGSEHNLY